MRSLEPESSQPSPEGNLPSAVSDGEPWSGVRPDILVCREGLGLGVKLTKTGDFRRGLVGPLKEGIILEAICTHALCWKTLWFRSAVASSWVFHVCASDTRVRTLEE